MRNSFDYYKQVEKPNMYLCNPDRKPIGFVNSENRHLVLRFNDLSELSFTVPKISGTENIYKRIETRRLLYIEKIGWFQITNVVESVEGNYEHKQVTAESHQTQLKSRGFISEERIYMFYNPNDPLDQQYDSSNLESVPSVIGQLYQQIGINVNIMVGNVEPEYDFGDWTLIYIDPALKFNAQSYDNQYISAKDADNICRSFTKKETFGYDFIINDVSKAFEVVFEFDYLYHSIKVKKIDDITMSTNIYFSLDNVMQSLNVTENSEDIVTVLSCNGNDLDIRTVNPMGTNYIVNFDYYKKETSDDGKIKFPWMSERLIGSLDSWEVEWNNWQSDDDSRVGHEKGYGTLVKDIQALYINQADKKADIQYSNLKLTDLQAARDHYLNGDNESEGGAGIVSPEDVKTSAISLNPTSAYFETNFSESSIITAYKTAPTPTKQDDQYKFDFSTSGEAGSVKSMLLTFMGEEKDGDGNWTESAGSTSNLYFSDDSTKASYCKILVSSEVGVIKDDNGNIGANGSTELRGVKFSVVSSTDKFVVSFPDGASLSIIKASPYFVYDGTRYKINQSTDGITTIYCFYASGLRRFTTYQELIGDQGWCVLWEKHIKIIDDEEKYLEGQSKAIEDEMAYVSDVCNVQKYIKRCGDDLYAELSNYWIEGEYNSNNLAAFDSTPIAERMELAKELMAAGGKELEKVSQPTFKLSISAINFIKLLKFKSFIDALELGRIITVEKDEQTHYRPALVSIEYDLDSSDSFSLSFSTAAKLDESAMTFADLLNTTSSTSRTISANWSNLTDYWKNKDKITSLLNAPLDRTLRATQANMANQEFTIDQTGILGRKWSDDSHAGFNNEQVRIINNTMIFTDDNWKTVRTALGKITYDDFDADGSSQEKQAYGLLAEVLVGSLIMGEKLKIINEKNTIALDDNGISIKNSDKDLVFLASTSGNVYIKGEIFATKLTLADGVTIEYNAIADAPDMSNFVAIENGYMQTGDYKYTSGTYSSSGMRIDLKNQYIRTENFAINQDGKVFTKGGVLGGFNIDEYILSCGSGVSSVGICSDSSGFAFWAGAETASEAPFRVSPDGNLHASNAEIKGDGIFNFISVTTDATIEGKFGASEIYGLEFVNSQQILTNKITSISSLTAIDLNYSTQAIETITATLSYTEGWNISQGNTSHFTVALSKPADNTRNFVIKYKTRDGYYHTATIGIQAGNVSAELLEIRKMSSEYYFVNTGTRTEVFSQAGSLSLAGIGMTGSIVPSENNSFSLGDSTHFWGIGYITQIYNDSSNITTSDKAKKTEIEKIQNHYEDFFDQLDPVSFKYINGNSKRKHIGFLAQDIKNALQKFDIPTESFAAYCEWKDNEGNLTCGLRYEEFIALCVDEIQKLKRRIVQLEKRRKRYKRK